MVVWPASMPDPVYPDIDEGAPRGVVLATDMDVGPQKTRPRSTAAVTPFSLTFAPVKAATVGAFRNFFKQDLAFGTLPFQMDHPITDAPETWKFSVENPYSIRPIGEDAYEIRCEMELQP